MLTNFVRAFPATLEQVAPNQLTGRLVPYDEPTWVLDELPDGNVDIYQEGFRRSAFSTQSGSKEPGVIRRIGLIHMHDGGLGFLGPFTSLREAPDGLWGDVRILPTKAPDVEALLQAGVSGLSIEFRLPGSGATQVDADGVRWRSRAHLDRVALEAKGAYTGAQVLAYRSEHAAEIAEAEEEARLAAEAEAAKKKQEIDEIAEVEAAQAEATERKRRWDELCAREEAERAKQAELIRSHGVTVPPHGGLPQKGY